MKKNKQYVLRTSKNREHNPFEIIEVSKKKETVYGKYSTLESAIMVLAALSPGPIQIAVSTPN